MQGLERVTMGSVMGSTRRFCAFQLTRIVTAVEFVGRVRKTVDPFVAAPRQRYTLAVIASPLVRLARTVTFPSERIITAELVALVERTID